MRPESLDLAQHELELDDVHDLAVAGGGQRFLQQRACTASRPLRVELLQRDAVAAARRVVPVGAVAVVEDRLTLSRAAGGNAASTRLGGDAHAAGRGRRRMWAVVRRRADGDGGQANGSEDMHARILLWKTSDGNAPAWRVRF
jgi:hypothetical protein